MSKNWWRAAARGASKVDRTGIPDGIRDWEINKGGYRYDADGKDFYLNWDQLLEFEKQNDALAEDDDGFYAWFKKFREDNKIGEKVWSTRSYTSWEDDEPKSKGKWLSSWWASDLHKGWSGAGTKENKLALVMNAVRTTIRVVDDTVPPLAVNWATESISYTDFAKHEIVINPKPVSTDEEGAAIDITTGFALHEASHSQYSREPYDTILKPEPLRPLKIAGMLLNFAEDIRIEAMTTEEMPGFAGYFEASLGWAWKESKPHLPKKWGPGIREKMNGILAIIRFPEGPATLTDPSFKDEIPWWTEWRDNYLSGKVGSRETIQRGLDHLREDEETAKEMDEMTKGEKELEKMLGDLKKALDKLTAEGLKELIDLAGVDGPVDKGDALEDGVGEKVESLLGESLTKEKIHIKTDTGYTQPPLYTRHPKETAHSKRSYIGKPNPVLSRLKASLIFRQELPRYTNRLLKSGRVDDEELWRWRVGDFRVFDEEVIAARPQVQLSFLVDMSGSMNGSKLRTAQELAQLLVWATKDMEGVDAKVFGHTGDVDEIAVEMFRLWEPGEPLTRLGLIPTLPHSQNYDGHAIAWCVKELQSRGQPEEQRLLFVLSDGYPAAHGYGGHVGEAHVKKVTTWAESQGIHVIQIAIDPSLDPNRQARMFKEFVMFKDLNDVPKQLTRLLAKYT